jgi:predicted RNA-binding Zn-ribbon protein involved in translation (DUF1610 family)
MPSSDPLKDAEIEIVCPGCGYRMTRTPDRLRRGTKLVCPECGQEIVGAGARPKTPNAG